MVSQVIKSAVGTIVPDKDALAQSGNATTDKVCIHPLAANHQPKDQRPNRRLFAAISTDGQGVFLKAHRLLYHSTQGVRAYLGLVLRVVKKKKNSTPRNPGPCSGRVALIHETCPCVRDSQHCWHDASRTHGVLFRLCGLGFRGSAHRDGL